ncbi:MAG: discoidin domain-containing protein, partial [bacterium]
MRILANVLIAVVTFLNFQAWAVSGRYVRVDIQAEQATLSLAEVQVFSGTENVARNGKASQVSTAWGGDAARAIDGNTESDWGKNSITHTEENVENPWWEVDLGTSKAIDKIVLWNRSGFEGRLNNARVMILDDKKIVQWVGQIGPAKMENSVDVKAGVSHPLIGKTLAAFKPAEVLNRRQLAALTLFNPVAMERAISNFANKYPDAYRNKVTLLSELSALSAEAKQVSTTTRDSVAQKVFDFSIKVYGQHPAMKTFSDVLYIRRHSSKQMGMPANWQGNSSTAVSGYDNE